MSGRALVTRQSNTVPFAINLAYMLLAGLALLLLPELGKQIFRVPEAPLYLARMSGVLVLMLAAVLAHSLRERDAFLLQGFGITQIGAALLYAGIVWLDHAPSTFWVVAYANLVLGLWTLMVAREQHAQTSSDTPGSHHA